jgi:hypothetical protein
MAPVLPLADWGSVESVVGEVEGGVVGGDATGVRVLLTILGSDGVGITMGSIPSVTRGRPSTTVSLKLVPAGAPLRMKVSRSRAVLMAGNSRLM